MLLRKYDSGDCREIEELFYNTVHSVNAADYSDVQLDAWAPVNSDLAGLDIKPATATR